MASPRTKLVTRHFGQRDARILPARTEPSYFNALKLNNIINKSRVVVKLVPTPQNSSGSTPANSSAPKYVLQRLKEAEASYELTPMDERWLVLDVDRWPKLPSIARQAIQAGYHLAVSNRCFEVWLLLHFVDEAPATKEELETATKTHVPGYFKKHVPPDPFTRESVDLAIERGRQGDSSNARWPSKPGTTHVHRLLTSILNIAASHG